LGVLIIVSVVIAHIFSTTFSTNPFIAFNRFDIVDLAAEIWPVKILAYGLPMRDWETFLRPSIIKLE